MSIIEGLQSRLVVEQPPGADPSVLVAALASSGRFQPHVVYERGSRWWFAGGALGTVVLWADRVVTSWADGEQVTPVTARPGAAVHAALEALPTLVWQAYGWASFELAYASTARHLLHHDEPLLHLVIPRVEVEVTAERARFPTASRHA